MKRWLQYTAILTCGHIVLSFLTWIMPAVMDFKHPSFGYFASDFLYGTMYLITLHPSELLGHILGVPQHGVFILLSLIITSTLIGGLLAGVCCLASKFQGERETPST